MNRTSNPYFSIIIATRNAELTLKNCLTSIANQSYSNIEIIIQDSLSSDSTLEIAQSFSTRILNLNIDSSPDKGIYDAWNKALARCLGEWILFLGADDILAADDILQYVKAIADKAPRACMFLAGGVENLFSDGTINYSLPGNTSLQEILKDQINTGHSALFHRRELFKNAQFDTKLKIGGDHDFLCRMWTSDNLGIKIDRLVTQMAFGGVSTRPSKQLRSQWERVVIRQKYFGSAWNFQRITILAKTFLIWLFCLFFGDTRSSIYLDTIRHLRGMPQKWGTQAELIEKTFPIRLFKASAMAIDCTAILLGRLFQKNQALLPFHLRILIIKTDATGDYILARHALRAIRQSQELTNAHITLCGNELWQDLAQVLDGTDNSYHTSFGTHDNVEGKKQQPDQRSSGTFDTFLPINPSIFAKNFLYRWKIFQSVNNQDFTHVINLCPSRSYLTDILTFATRSRCKIGFHGDTINQSKFRNIFTSRWYTHLYTEKTKFLFETIRLHEFIVWAGLCPNNNSRPFLSKININTSEKDDYHGTICFFLGGSKAFRRWSSANVSRLIARLTEHGIMNSTLDNRRFILLGGSDCSNSAKDILRIFPETVIDLTGQTSLPELMFIIQQARLVISNDSVAAHMAASCKTPCVMISNGQHLGRFHPYPEEYANNWVAVYPPNLSFNDANTIRSLYASPSNKNIDEVTPEQVEQVITEIFATDCQLSHHSTPSATR